MGVRREAHLYGSGSVCLMKEGGEVVIEFRFPCDTKLLMAAWFTPEETARREYGLGKGR